MKTNRIVYRLLLLALGMFSLLVGVLAGLVRLGWSMPPLAAAASGWHGALMISCFFGAVISLERAVAIGRGWAYLAPAAAGVGGALLIGGAPLLLTQLLLIAAAGTLLAASVLVLRILLAPFTVILTIAALCWLAGNIAWLLSGVVATAVPCWLAFLVLTIAAERLELTRFLPTPARAQHWFLAIVGAVLLGASCTFWREGPGLALFSASLLALAAWLLRYDLARHNARQQGLTRFIAICLLSGYAWLILAGLLGLAGGFLPDHPWRDASLHAVSLGFVFAMIFGHTPIIFPAVAQIKIPYHRSFYLPLLALHVSLALRIVGGLGGEFNLRHEGALANAFVLLLFIATMMLSIVRK
ncbi:MAG: hypothetical protein HYZ65_06985 [Burkholderiales bacterium]|nr:hypothetical protein [Burkholderiales bacterium]